MPLHNVMMMTSDDRFRLVTSVNFQNKIKSALFLGFYCFKHKYSTSNTKTTSTSIEGQYQDHHIQDHHILYFIFPLQSKKPTLIPLFSTSNPILQYPQCLLPTPAANPPIRSANLVPSSRMSPALARPKSANTQRPSSRSNRQSTLGIMC